MYGEVCARLASPSGAGGKEASLFTAEIFLMYQKFSAFKQWKFDIFEEDITDGGGLKVGPLLGVSLSQPHPHSMPVLV